MQTIIGCTVWMLFTVLVMFFMSQQTNNRIKLLDSENAEISVEGEETEINEIPSCYSLKGQYIVAAILLLAVSALSAYIAFENAISIIAFIELCICFHAVFGAAIIDFKLKIIPNYISISLIIIRFLIFIYEMAIKDENALKNFGISFIECFILAIIMVIADRFSKGGVGAGDTKLIASMGFLCGIYSVITVLTLSLTICACVALLFLITKKKTTKDVLPFGPFIFLGYVAMIFLSLIN